METAVVSSILLGYDDCYVHIVLEWMVHILIAKPKYHTIVRSINIHTAIRLKITFIIFH